MSSSILNPISTGGRILDVVMEAYAITVVASMAGSIGAYMAKRGRELERAAEEKASVPKRPEIPITNDSSSEVVPATSHGSSHRSKCGQDQSDDQQHEPDHQTLRRSQ